MAAHVVAQGAEPPLQPGEHPVPDPEIGAERVGEYQGRVVRRPVEGVVDRRAVDDRCLHAVPLPRFFSFAGMLNRGIGYVK